MYQKYVKVAYLDLHTLSNDIRYVMDKSLISLYKYAIDSQTRYY